MILVTIAAVPKPVYRGRFAPTPSGPLHIGSLFTALASWLSARHADGEWHLRIDDLDGPRCAPGADSMIQQQLEAHGLYWDGAVVYQSTRIEHYRAALATLAQQGQLFACTCTRALLASQSLAGPDGPVYAGTCRQNTVSSVPARQALRFRVEDGPWSWTDAIHGSITRIRPHECGDFVVRRADGQIGYHLACALDEHDMGITDVVRGDDLLGSTTQQLQLMQALGLASPRYAHVPVIIAADGRKLSKQNGAASLLTHAEAVRHQLRLCLERLGLNPPAELTAHSVPELLQWAQSAWNPGFLKAARPDGKGQAPLP